MSGAQQGASWAQHLRRVLVIGALAGALGLGAYGWASTVGAKAKAQAAVAVQPCCP